MRFRARVVFNAVSVLRSLRVNSARGPGLAPGALCRNRFLDVLLPDGLQLLVLRGAKNFLQLRRAFAVDGVELLHLLHSGKRRIILDRLEFWSFGLKDGQHSRCPKDPACRWFVLATSITLRRIYLFGFIWG